MHVIQWYLCLSVEEDVDPTYVSFALTERIEKQRNGDAIKAAILQNSNFEEKSLST